MAYELIETIEVGAGGAASIEFTSIPQDGVDLLFTYSLRDNRTATASPVAMTLNSSSSNFSQRSLVGTGSSAFSSSSTISNRVGEINSASSTTNTFASGQIYISNYISASAKSFGVEQVFENNATAAEQSLIAGRWNDTSAITAASFSMVATADFVAGSTISLYKIS